MLHTLRFSLQNAVYFITLPILVPALFTFYIQSVLKLKCKTSVPLCSYYQISPGQKLQINIQTDGNNIQPHTAQTHNERISTKSNLVTPYSIAHEPPEDGRKYGPKHFNIILRVLNINVN
jgi:hypothetical protein